MRHKKFFIAAAAAAVFVLSMLVGHWLWPLYQNQKAEKEKAALEQAGVLSDAVVNNFAAQFDAFMVAKEPMRLPADTFRDASGKEWRFSDFEGKPTLVNFWATWCTPCVVELPHLDKLAEYYDGRLNVVAVALERGKTMPEIADFLEKRQIGVFAAYQDDTGKLAENLALRGIPTSFLIGKDGLILYRFEGDADWTTEAARNFFDAFLLQQ
jgi:thiol-disulfide isomerase/thioredoxin